MGIKLTRITPPTPRLTKPLLLPFSRSEFPLRQTGHPKRRIQSANFSQGDALNWGGSCMDVRGGQYSPSMRKPILLNFQLYSPYKAIYTFIDNNLPSTAISPTYRRLGTYKALSAFQMRNIPLNAILRPHFKCDLFTPISNRGITAP